MSSDRTSSDKFPSNSAKYSQCHQNKSSVIPPNVPLIDLPRLQTSNPWSLIEYYKSSDYFASKSYLNDALHVSFRIPITHHRRISCSIDNNHNNRWEKDYQPINIKRMTQLIFGSHPKLNPKHPCIKQHTHSKKTSKEKNPHSTSKRKLLPKKHQQILKNPSISFILPPPPKSKSHFNSPLNLTSHTRFGKSMLALYFQKYRYISPMDTNKKEQFLRLLKPSVKSRIKKN